MDPLNQFLFEVGKQVPSLAVLCLLVRWFLFHLGQDRVSREKSEERQDNALAVLAKECGVALSETNRALGSHKEMMSRLHGAVSRMERMRCSLDNQEPQRQHPTPAV